MGSRTSAYQLDVNASSLTLGIHLHVAVMLLVVLILLTVPMSSSCERNFKYALFSLICIP